MNQFGNPQLVVVPCAGTASTPQVLSIPGVIIAGIDNSSTIQGITAFAGLLPIEVYAISASGANGLNHTDLYGSIMSGWYQAGHTVEVTFIGNVIYLTQ